MASSVQEFAEKYDFMIEKALGRSRLMQQGASGYEDISASLKNILSGYDTEVHFYGSRVIGIANPTSDLDIFIDVEGGPNLAPRSGYYDGRSKTEQIRILQILKANFLNSPYWNVEKSGILYNATVPILYAHYKRNGRDLHCKTFNYIFAENVNFLTYSNYPTFQVKLL